MGNVTLFKRKLIHQKEDDIKTKVTLTVLAVSSGCTIETFTCICEVTSTFYTDTIMLTRITLTWETSKLQITSDWLDTVCGGRYVVNHWLSAYKIRCCSWCHQLVGAILLAFKMKLQWSGVTTTHVLEVWSIFFLQLIQTDMWHILEVA